MYLFLGSTNQYMKTVFVTLGILSIFVFGGSCFYAWVPKTDVKNIFSPFSIILRFIPYVLLILICRVGVFMVISPTALNDQSQMIPAVMFGSMAGFLGIVP